MSKKTVLVIDDDETITSIVKATLKKNGYEAISACHGEGGLQMVSDKTPDAIVLDRKMPGMDGNDVLKALKENPETQDIPVMMLTGETAITDVSSSLELGALDYIVKPFDHENFLIRLKNIMRKTS